ncbi:(+)-larreatricin hydroxylase, chloroplastic-like [Salvia hispanica]|uniref:(+)-larreatricin hydroxylase, chloroplastic-like n=1 Tax=Salvia hispanica TaxID=49212 RepID=UPI002009C0B2|nr:(+)-larreatricin hydroxylase, chloroplastic-like [Salvia hispanica]
MTPEYLAKYKLAIQRMKDLDTTDPDDPRGFAQQANVHCAYCNGPYDQVSFPTLDILPFQEMEWYLYFFGRICGELIGDPTFALPYWNWDHPDGMYMPKPFTEPYSPLYDYNDGESVKTNLNQMQQEMIVQSDNDALTFMGTPYRAVDPPHGVPDGRPTEGGSYIGIHVWTGNPKNPYNENMGNFYSSAWDPIFYCQHANIDHYKKTHNSDEISNHQMPNKSKENLLCATTRGGAQECGTSIWCAPVSMGRGEGSNTPVVC